MRWRHGGFATVLNQELTENFGTVRADHRFSNQMPCPAPTFCSTGELGVPDPLNNTTFPNLTTRQMVAIEQTHTFSQNFVNALRRRPQTGPRIVSTLPARRSKSDRRRHRLGKCPRVRPGQSSRFPVLTAHLWPWRPTRFSDHGTRTCFQIYPGRTAFVTSSQTTRQVSVRFERFAVHENRA